MNDLTHYTKDYYQRDIAENWFDEYGLLRPDQLAAFCYAVGLPFWGDENLKRRNPGLIYSIGAGTGVLESFLENQGFRVTGVDPSPGAKKLYRGKKLIDRYKGGGKTIIFCEAIEHIPRGEILRILGLVPTGSRVIIVNWLSHHPITPDKSSWDHITQIDDGFFKYISTGWRVLVKRFSHLVMEQKR